MQAIRQKKMAHTLCRRTLEQLQRQDFMRSSHFLQQSIFLLHIVLHRGNQTEMWLSGHFFHSRRKENDYG